MMRCIDAMQRFFFRGVRKVCSYRLGLVAGLFSRIRGKEVALLSLGRIQIQGFNTQTLNTLMTFSSGLKCDGHVDRGHETERTKKRES